MDRLMRSYGGGLTFPSARSFR
ncbi:hypothetical protein GDI3607 [Gluconacetobacter diazotrophicus PA1 5]|uniref:Uncharacterized protein n=1 Tax=Gluconacetobacter diazotrophicus (strain ATCC 49037 / DSM 5601 / CCUG 37298 / CIP 103539 / LMG 7603 / PAl5) TaxID=272568 RepID=A9H6U4_GLUDA|nr:hypothetical protein GDI3607 [Gluconacetobacter diazotrophicus PA1 5]